MKRRRKGAAEHLGAVQLTFASRRDRRERMFFSSRFSSFFHRARQFYGNRNESKLSCIQAS